MKKRSMCKKILALSMAVLLLTLSFTACGQKKEENKPSQNTPVSAGTFSLTGLHGEVVTEEIFKQSKLTLINVMATWCGPCVQEMPELQKLSEAYKEKGLTVIAIVMDSVNSRGQVDETAIQEAKRLGATAGITFPMLQPQPNILAGRLDRVSSLPTTFFVDANGNFVGKAHIGAKDYSMWSSVVDKLLAEVGENA